jgi:hypothetical protein
MPGYEVLNARMKRTMTGMDRQRTKVRNGDTNETQLIREPTAAKTVGFTALCAAQKGPCIAER